MTDIPLPPEGYVRDEARLCDIHGQVDRLIAEEHRDDDVPPCEPGKHLFVPWEVPLKLLKLGVTASPIIFYCRRCGRWRPL